MEGSSASDRLLSTERARGAEVKIPKHMPLRDKLILGPIDKYRLYSKWMMMLTSRSIPMEDGADFPDCGGEHRADWNSREEHSASESSIEPSILQNAHGPWGKWVIEVYDA